MVARQVEMQTTELHREFHAHWLNLCEREFICTNGISVEVVSESCWKEKRKGIWDKSYFIFLINYTVNTVRTVSTSHNFVKGSLVGRQRERIEHLINEDPDFYLRWPLQTCTTNAFLKSIVIFFEINCSFANHWPNRGKGSDFCGWTKDSPMKHQSSPYRLVSVTFAVIFYNKMV